MPVNNAVSRMIGRERTPIKAICWTQSLPRNGGSRSQRKKEITKKTNSPNPLSLERTRSPNRSGTSRIAIRPGNSLRHAAKDFIRNSFRQFPQLLRPDFLPPLSPEQDRLIAGLRRRQPRQIDHHHIHADRPDNRHTPAPYQNSGPVRQQPRVTVRVSP